MPRQYTPEEQVAAFWSRVNKDGPTMPGMDTPCWVWTGGTQRKGYGRAQRLDGKQDGAHRVAYMLAAGPIPDGLHILHACDNPPCVRPDHLRAGSAALNLAEMRAKGRHSHGENHSATLRGRQYRGEIVPNSKLTEDDVRNIRLSAALGRHHAILAKQFNVSRRNIRHIVNRQSWKHIGDTP